MLASRLWKVNRTVLPRTKTPSTTQSGGLAWSETCSKPSSKPECIAKMLWQRTIWGFSGGTHLSLHVLSRPRPLIKLHSRTTTNSASAAALAALDGSWCPYGGRLPALLDDSFQLLPWLIIDRLITTLRAAGASQCPGRLLAKDTIMAACILLVQGYDIKIDTDRLDLVDSLRFGLSVARPRNYIAARMRKRGKV